MPLGDYATQLNGQITADQKLAWEKGRSRVWANESFKVAVDHVYAGVAADGPPTHLNETYVTKGRQVVDQQLSKAGIRLAKVLNEAFPE
jgi:hypothetical protein